MAFLLNEKKKIVRAVHKDVVHYFIYILIFPFWRNNTGDVANDVVHHRANRDAATTTGSYQNTI